MLVNTAWLLQYLDPQVSHADLLDAFPRVGLEIENLHDLRSDLQTIKVGFVREMAPLPGATGMYACQIELSRGHTVPVVCASEHEVQVGWGVPVAPAGTRLPGGKAIAAGTVHGQRSEGMICLDGEMGLLARGSGMQIFRDESALGRSLPEVSEVGEYLVELNVLPNRPDCLGVIGIAREVAALLGLKLKYPPTPLAAPAGTNPRVSVDLQAPDLCPRYMCRLVEGVKVAPSPAWMKSVLLTCGSRPINNVVDVTNFILYEWGQPLHAFNFAQIRGGRIVVRRMRPGEKLELLTGKVVEATGENTPLVIADAERALALAGVMGGRDSQTDEQTRDVLIEAAHFDPVNIRQTVRRIDVGTEARGTPSSYRFERGTDPNRMVEGALHRATSLIVELAGGKPVGPPVDAYPARREPRKFRVNPVRATSYLGTPIDAATIRDTLGRLEMTCSQGGDAAEPVEVAVPTWRADVNDPVVLIEDVARLVGYDRVPAAPGAAHPTGGRVSTTDRLRAEAARHLAAAGFLEARNPSLEPAEVAAWLDAQAAPVRVANPANRDMTVLRRSLLTGLLATAERNVRRGATSVRFFEIDRTFRAAPAANGFATPVTGRSGAASAPDGNGRGDGNTRPAGSTGVSARWTLGVIAGGTLREFAWRGGGAAYDFFDLKGELESLLESLGVDRAAFRPVTQPPYLAGVVASFATRADAAAPVGYVGRLDPGAVDVGKVPFPLFAFEVDLEALEAEYLSLPGYQTLARTPAVTRDLAIVVKATDAYSQIEQAIRGSAGAELEELWCVDRYQGNPVPQGHQSLAFRLQFRDPARTLTAEEVSATMGQIVRSLEQQFGATLRG